jgi:hypothetical protein
VRRQFASFVSHFLLTTATRRFQVRKQLEVDMREKRRSAAFLIAAAGLAVLGRPAAAQTGTISVEIGSIGEVVARILVTVPVTVTCTSVDQGLPFVHLDVFQGAGRTTAYALGDTAVICDGTERTYQVNALAITTPFHGGRAVASAFVQNCDIGATVCEFGSDGPQLISMR